MFNPEEYIPLKNRVIIGVYNFQKDDLSNLKIYLKKQNISNIEYLDIKANLLEQRIKNQREKLNKEESKIGMISKNWLNKYQNEIPCVLIQIIDITFINIENKEPSLITENIMREMGKIKSAFTTSSYILIIKNIFKGNFDLTIIKNQILNNIKLAKDKNIIIMNDNPNKVYEAYKIAKSARRTSIFNIVFALTIKFSIELLTLITYLLGHGEIVPMWAAVLADTGLTVVLVINSFLLLYRKINGDVVK